MKTLFTVLMTLLTFAVTSQSLTFEGDVLTSEPYNMTIEECDSTWDTTSTYEVEYYRGVFGKKTDFTIFNLENKKYRIIFETVENPRKVIFVDLRMLNEEHYLEVIIDPHLPNVMLSWCCNNLIWAHCITD